MKCHLKSKFEINAARPEVAGIQLINVARRLVRCHDDDQEWIKTAIDLVKEQIIGHLISDLNRIELMGQHEILMNAFNKDITLFQDKYQGIIKCWASFVVNQSNIVPWFSRVECIAQRSLELLSNEKCHHALS